MNIKATIIHLLGGYTEGDVNNKRSGWENSLIDYGYRKCVNEIKAFAQSIYGIEADDWCKQMYEHINSMDNVRQGRR